MEKNYYDILGISKSATASEIKRAYALLVRKYPPEKFKEEFSEIREAYDCLMNPQKRNDYDEISGVDEVAQDLLNAALRNIEEENYYLAIEKLKEFISMEPNSNVVKTYLLICYSKINMVDEVYRIANEVIDSNDKLKEIYFINLYDVCMDLSKYSEAEECLNKAIEMFDTFDVNFSLVKLYANPSYLNKEKAKEILRNKISKIVGLKGYYLDDYLSIAYYSAILSEVDLIEKYLQYVMNICKKDDLEQTSYQLLGYADLLTNRRKYKEMVMFINMWIKLQSKFSGDSEETKFKIEAYEHVCKIYDELEKADNDENIIPPISGFVANKIRILVAVDKEKRKGEINRLSSKILKIINEVLETAPYEVKSSIECLKENYKLVYQEVDRDIEKLYRIAERKVEDSNDNAFTVQLNKNFRDKVNREIEKNNQSTKVPEKETSDSKPTKNRYGLAIIFIIVVALAAMYIGYTLGGIK